MGRRKPTARIEFVLFNVIYEDGTVTSNRKVPSSMMGLPSIAVPCGFDQWGRPVGLQVVGRHRGEAALLQAAALFEGAMGLAQHLPIDPRPGTVPPST